jgi:phosphoribosylformylglycinamidine cyclo-ligase
MQYDVNYDPLDLLKREAQAAARATDANIEDLNFHIVEESRGESVLVIDEGDRFTAHVVEGLGTKNRVAEEVHQVTGESFFRAIAQDGAAMVLNDLVVCGARPVLLNMYIAIGREEYFSPKDCRSDIVWGWKTACDAARCAWGGGETPKLRDIIMPDTMDLGGSGYGVIRNKAQRILGEVIDDDAIVFAPSTGVHANGLTLVRDIAETLPDRYQTTVPGGRTYGEEVLIPTPLYSELIQFCLKNQIWIHRVENITGHGWRKIMRGMAPYTYVIEQLPPKLPIFDFIQDRGALSDRQMYETYNMGVGLALIMPPGDAYRLVRMDEGKRGLFVAGHVDVGPKRVVIKPKRLEFAGETLGVR